MKTSSDTNIEIDVLRHFTTFSSVKSWWQGESQTSRASLSSIRGFGSSSASNFGHRLCITGAATGPRVSRGPSYGLRGASGLRAQKKLKL